MSAQATDLDWKQAGACRGEDPAIWFPEVGQTADVARSFCVGCPVRAMCLDYALSTRQKFGVWGGATEGARRSMRRARRRAEAVGATPLFET